MSWVRIEDRFALHPKVVGLSDGAFRLYVSGLCYANLYHTDGRISHAAALALYAPEDHSRELVEIGLWHDQPEGGFAIHDFAEYQFTAEEAEERRSRIAAARSVAGRAGAMARWQRAGKAIANTIANGWQSDSPIPTPIPLEDKKESTAAAPPTSPAPKFKRPTAEEVRAYCVEKRYTFDPEAFVAFYESNGWKVGAHSMKSWQAACVTWQKREPGNRPLVQMPRATGAAFPKSAKLIEKEELDEEAERAKRNREAELREKRLKIERERLEAAEIEKW